MPNLSAGITNVTYSGAMVEYTALAPGVLDAKLWGGAGGGGIATNDLAGEYGGGGGYAFGSILVAAGDVIRVEVGGGGTKGISQSVRGQGGWPDGGKGGWGSHVIYCGGGGGGSTRIWKNGVLMLVAGGGGGGCFPRGGAGGGANGQSPTGAYNGGLGGTQTGPGGGNAAALKGADSPGHDGVASNLAGGGGGGGWYGGGYAAITNSYRGGGGGSGYKHPSLVGAVITTGSDRLPGNSAEAPAGIGKGGVTGRATAGLITDGEPGYVTMTFVADAVGGGPIGTITLTQPVQGSATGSVNISRAIPSVAVQAITGTASGPTVVNALLEPLVVARSALPVATARVAADASGNLGAARLISPPTGTVITLVNAYGDLPTIDIQSLIEGGPQFEAIVIIDLAFAIDPPSVEALLGADATGAGLGSGPSKTITVIPPSGIVIRDGEIIAVLDSTITVTPVEGFGSSPISVPLGVAPVAVSQVVQGSATGQGRGVFALPLEVRTVSVVNGLPQTPPMVARGDFPQISAEAPRGVAVAGDDVVLAVGMEIPYISSEYTGGTTVQGFAEAVSLLNNPSQDGNVRYMCRVIAGREQGTPQGSATGIADVIGNLDTLSVVVQPPVGVTQRGASVNAPIGTVFVRRVNAAGGENPNIIVGDAYPEPTPDITITPPDVLVMVDAAASGDIGVITVLPVVGPALAFFPTIQITPVAGTAVGYTSDAVYVEVDIGVVNLSPIFAYMKPTRFMQLKAVINLTETAEAVIDPVENYTARADSVERVTAVVRG